MSIYYINKQAQSNGDHEVHKDDCTYLPSLANRKYLGDHLNCKSAVTEAKKTYTQSNGCKTCCPDCHSS